jgi:hypothetical protein
MSDFKWKHQKIKFFLTKNFLMILKFNFLQICTQNMLTLPNKLWTSFCLLKKNQWLYWRLFPARQVPVIILNEFFKNTGNALQKETTRYFQICKISNAWKLPSSFSLKSHHEVQNFTIIGQFFFQNDVFKLLLDFSELGSFQTFLNLQIWDKPKVLKRFQKQFWKLESKPKNLHSLFLEHSLRTISEAWSAGKNLKTESDSEHQNKARIVGFFQKTKSCWVV